MDKLAELLAWIAIDAKLGKDIDISETEEKNWSLPKAILHLTCVAILVVGFILLAFL